MAVQAPSRKRQNQTTEETASPWQVVVLDDPVNLMAYVTRVIMRVFSYDQTRAENLMMQVHQRGRAVVWSGGREKAEMYVQQLHQAQLHASLERAG